MPMPRVVIEPEPPDLMFHGEQFDEIAGVLRAEGFEASVQPAEFEKRTAVLDLAVRLLDDVEGEIVGTLATLLVTELKKRLPRQRRRYRRRVVIYGPRGDILKTVEIEHEGDEDTPKS